jgi:putative aldouronate transport system permease protein
VADTHIQVANLKIAEVRKDSTSTWSCRWRRIKQNRWLYLMMLPAIVYFGVFHYLPMFGVVIAFKRYDPFTGIWASPWVGFKHFDRFFSSIYFFRLIQNTVLLNLYGLIAGFPAPIILALLLNEVARPLYKRVVQTVSYLPHFVSTVVIAGMIVNFLSPTTGLVNVFIKALGFQPVNFLVEPEWFRHIYVWSGIWQGLGWSSIIYLAALAGIDPTLYESAEIDGAGRLAKMWYISIPGIMPVIMVILLLNLGSMLYVGFEKVFLLYNPSTYETADVISTYVYRVGLVGLEYDFAAAVGLFNSVVSLILLSIFNWLAGRLQQQTLW